MKYVLTRDSHSAGMQYFKKMIGRHSSMLHTTSLLTEAYIFDCDEKEIIEIPENMLKGQSFVVLQICDKDLFKARLGNK